MDLRVGTAVYDILLEVINTDLTTFMNPWLTLITHVFSFLLFCIVTFFMTVSFGLSLYGTLTGCVYVLRINDIFDLPFYHPVYLE